MRRKLYKVIKLFFSRVFLVALTVLIEIASSILGVLLFVTLINKKMNPEHKIMILYLLVLHIII